MPVASFENTKIGVTPDNVLRLRLFPEIRTISAYVSAFSKLDQFLACERQYCCVSKLNDIKRMCGDGLRERGVRYKMLAVGVVLFFLPSVGT
jgi:hypothetical protein